MKINAVISSDIIKRNGFFKDKIQIFCFLVLSSALITGTILYVLSEEYLTEDMFRYFTGFYLDFSSKTTLEVFSGIILSHLPYVLLMIVFGTSSVGCYFVAAISFIKASGMGLISAYLYSSFGLKGIEYALLIFFPGKFLMIFSILFIMHSGINNALYVKGLTKGEYRAEKSSNLYAVKAVTAVLLFILSSLVDCFLAVSFSSLFVF